MTQGEKSSRAARENRKEIKRTVPTGQRDPLTGKPIMKRMSFYGKHKEDSSGAEESHRAYLRSLLLAPEPTERQLEGTLGWYYVNRYAPLVADGKANTVRSIEDAGKHLMRHAGGTTAKDFKAPELAQLLRLVGGSASKRNKVRLLALSLNELAAEEDADVRLISRKRVKPAKQTAPKLVVQSPRESLAIALSVPAQYRIAALLQAAFGVRAGESVGPNWEHVTPLGSIRIEWQDDGAEGRKEELKNETSHRELPLPAFLEEIMREARAEQRKRGFGKPSDPISVTRNGTPVSESNLRRAVKAARERLEMPAYKGRPCHIFRHSLATFLNSREVGCPEPTRLAIMGHSREDVKNRYVHVSTAEMLPYIEMWAASAQGAQPKERQWRGGTKTPASGERNGRAKVTQAKADALRDALRAEGATLVGVARDFGISPRQARDIREGKVWNGGETSTCSVVAATTSQGVRPLGD